MMPGGEVILMTGDASLATAIAAVREGVFAYVQRPFAPEDLLALGVRALAQVQLLRERARLAGELAVSERLYRGVVEFVESLIVGLDREGGSECGTAAPRSSRLVARGAARPPVRRHGDRRGPARAVPRRVQQAWRDRRLLEHEFTVLARDGRTTTVRWSAARWRPRATAIELLLLVGNDVTERLALEKRAADAEAMSVAGDADGRPGPRDPQPAERGAAAARLLSN